MIYGESHYYFTDLLDYVEDDKDMKTTEAPK